MILADRVEVKAERMSGHVDVRFLLDKRGRRAVEFGGDMRTDTNNAVTINGVDYVAAAVRIVEQNTGDWRRDAAVGWGLTRVGFERWGNAHPTPKAASAFAWWCRMQAPRLAERHHSMWAGVLSAHTRPDFDARQIELRAQMRRVNAEAEMWELIEAADDWRVESSGGSRGHWESGFITGNHGSTSMSGDVEGRILVEIGGEWVAVGWVCVGHDRRQRLLPDELVTVRG